jgi:hypothetical protein
MPPVRLLEVDGVDGADVGNGVDGAGMVGSADGDAVVVDDLEEGKSLPLSIVDAFEALASSTAFFSALARAIRVAWILFQLCDMVKKMRAEEGETERILLRPIGSGVEEKRRERPRSHSAMFWLLKTG